MKVVIVKSWMTTKQHRITTREFVGWGGRLAALSPPYWGLGGFSKDWWPWQLTNTNTLPVLSGFRINLSITKSTNPSGIVCHLMESPLIVLNLTWAHHEVLSLYENKMAKLMGNFMKLSLKCKFGFNLYLKKSLTYLHLPTYVYPRLFLWCWLQPHSHSWLISRYQTRYQWEGFLNCLLQHMTCSHLPTLVNICFVGIEMHFTVVRPWPGLGLSFKAMEGPQYPWPLHSTEALWKFPDVLSSNFQPHLICLKGKKQNTPQLCKGKS